MIKAYRRKTGSLGEYDKTSYLLAQKEWGPQRANRPAVLFEFKELDGAHPATNPRWLCCSSINGTRVVVDTINYKPLRAFPHIPLTVSTKVEGWLLEAWFRLDPALQAEDLIQRMPYAANHDVYKDRNVMNRLARRRGLFREEGRCLSWAKQMWTKNWDQFLIKEMTDNPDKSNSNSTRHLVDLTTARKKALKDETYAGGKYLNRAGKRALQGERKEQKQKEVEERRSKRDAEQVDEDLMEFMTKGNDKKVGKKTQVKSRKRKRTETQITRNTTTAQPEDHSTSTTVVDPQILLPHENIQSASHPRVGQPPAGYQNQTLQTAQAAQTADPQAKRYPAAPLMSGNQSRDRQGLYQTSNQHQMQPKSQHTTNHPAHPNLVISQEMQQFQARSGRSSGSAADTVVGPFYPPSYSQGRSRRSTSLPTNLTLGGDPLQNYTQSQLAPLSATVQHNIGGNETQTHPQLMNPYHQSNSMNANGQPNTYSFPSLPQPADYDPHLNSHLNAAEIICNHLPPHDPTLPQFCSLPVTESIRGAAVSEWRSLC
jgi:hypothetical protein